MPRSITPPSRHSTLSTFKPDEKATCVDTALQGLSQLQRDHREHEGVAEALSRMSATLRRSRPHLDLTGLPPTAVQQMPEEALTLCGPFVAAMSLPRGVSPQQVERWSRVLGELTRLNQASPGSAPTSPTSPTEPPIATSTPVPESSGAMPHRNVLAGLNRGRGGATPTLFPRLPGATGISPWTRMTTFAPLRTSFAPSRPDSGASSGSSCPPSPASSTRSPDRLGPMADGMPPLAWRLSPDEQTLAVADRWCHRPQRQLPDALTPELAFALIALIDLPGSDAVPDPSTAQCDVWRQRALTVQKHQAPLPLTTTETKQLQRTLQDLMQTTCRRHADGTWTPKDSEHLAQTRALAQWAREPSSSAAAAARGHVQRLLLAQHSGQQLDITLDDTVTAMGDQPLPLPPAGLLHELLHYQCRVTLNLSGEGGGLAPETAESLGVLPLRAVGVNSLSMLERLAHVQRSSVRTVSLTRLDLSKVSDCDRARQALAAFPHVAEMTIGYGLPQGYMGDEWVQEAATPRGIVHRLEGHADGLAQMDHACLQWHGGIFGTQSRLRRQACDPHMLALFRWLSALAEPTQRDGEAAQALREAIFLASDDPSFRQRLVKRLAAEGWKLKASEGPVALPVAWEALARQPGAVARHVQTLLTSTPDSASLPPAQPFTPTGATALPTPSLTPSHAQAAREQGGAAPERPTTLQHPGAATALFTTPGNSQAAPARPRAPLQPEEGLTRF